MVGIGQQAAHLAGDRRELGDREIGELLLKSANELAAKRSTTASRGWSASAA